MKNSDHSTRGTIKAINAHGHNKYLLQRIEDIREVHILDDEQSIVINAWIKEYPMGLASDIPMSKHDMDTQSIPIARNLGKFVLNK